MCTLCTPPNYYPYPVYNYHYHDVDENRLREIVREEIRETLKDANISSS